MTIALVLILGALLVARTAPRLLDGCPRASGVPGEGR